MTRHPDATKPFTCATCEIEIAGRPTFHVGLPFCCAGCVAGGPCTCSYDAEAATDPESAGLHVRFCLDIESALFDAPVPPRARALVATR
jgi:hypothetical protein